MVCTYIWRRKGHTTREEKEEEEAGRPGPGGRIRAPPVDGSTTGGGSVTSNPNARYHGAGAYCTRGSGLIARAPCARWDGDGEKGGKAVLGWNGNVKVFGFSLHRQPALDGRQLASASAQKGPLDVVGSGCDGDRWSRCGMLDGATPGAGERRRRATPSP